MTESVILWVVTGLVGACFGSFLTLVTHRLPREEKIGMTRSQCPQCSTTLTVADLFPILSWVASKGKCRHCHAKVNARYPLTEIACALGALGAMSMYGFTLEAFAIAGLWWSIVAIIVTDLEHYIILDEVQVAIIIFGALYHYALGTEISDIITSAFTGLTIGLALKYGFLYLRNKDGLGLGDVKLLFGVGVWLSTPMSFVPFLFFSGVLGVVFGLLWRMFGRGEIFPFGPALATALLLCVVWPELAYDFWGLYGLIGMR